MLPSSAASLVALCAVMACAAACTSAGQPAAPGADGADWEFTMVPARTPSPVPTPSPETALAQEQDEISLGPGLELAGDLTQGRWGLTATLMPDGSVVAAGGQRRRGFSRSVSGVADVLLPGADGWESTGPVTYERTFHVAASLPDGRLLVAGGAGSKVERDEDRPFRIRTDLATTEIYDPETGEWSEAAPMLTARQSAGVATLSDGRVLVVGGASGVAIEDGTEIYDPASDRWARAASMGVPRRLHRTIGLPDGRVMVVGGETRSVAHASAEIYDPQSDSWERVADMEEPRSGHAATLLKDGRVLVVGGSDLGAADGLGPETTAEVFDPQDGSWNRVATGLLPRRGHAVVTLGDGRALVVGGEDLVGLSVGPMELYDPETGDWEVVGSLPDERTLLNVIAMPDGTALIVGGGTSSGFGEFPNYTLRYRVPE